MRTKVATLKGTIAIIFADINGTNAKKGINLTYKYKSEAVEDGKFKGWMFTVTAVELGHKERDLQVLRFKRPDNIDKYNMEYNVLMSVLSSGMDTALMVWNETGKLLNVDPKMQEAARETLRNDD